MNCFRRQAPVGKYIVDFICHKKALIIEVYRGQCIKALNADDKRTAWLKAYGYRVIQFWNDQVLKEIGGVLQEVLWHLHQKG